MDLLQDVVGSLKRGRDAIQGVAGLKTTLRRRYDEYSSVIELLESKPDAIAANDLEHELGQLNKLFTKVGDLKGVYIAAPGDGRLTKTNKISKRAADYEDVNTTLEEVDRDVTRQLHSISVKLGVRGWKRMDDAIGRLERQVVSLPKLAAVPLGAPPLNRYVERPLLLGSTIASLTNTALVKRPCVLAGMGGAGKSILASAVVRDEKVREHFHAGIFWLRVGRNAKDQLHESLQGLVLRVAATSGTLPPQFETLEETTRYLKTVNADGASSRLIVLDDVWEVEVVDTLQLTGMKLLVTKRDRSVVSTRGECVEVGDMDDDEALEVLRVGCEASVLPTTEALQVAGDCGMLALALGLAAPLIKGPPQEPDSWRTLHYALRDVLAKRLGTDRVMTVAHRVDAVLEVSLGAMADDPGKRKRCVFLAVLAPGTLAPLDMLEDLWDEADGAARAYAAQLVAQSMLQPVDRYAYRVHDVILHFLKTKLKADPSLPIATSRVVEHLGQLKVLHRYLDAESPIGNVLSLSALWRSVEALSGESQVAAVYTRNLHGITHGFPWFEAGRVLEFMGRYGEADPLFERSLYLCIQSRGPEHPDVAAMLTNRANLLMVQGKYLKAATLVTRAQEINENVFGPNDPRVATIVNNRAGLLQMQGKLSEAEPLYRRAIKIGEETLGDHPDLAMRLSNLADLLRRQGNYTEADPLFRRAIEIGERTLDPGDPDLANWLNNWAELFRAQGEYSKAEPLYRRAEEMFETSLGRNHHKVATILNNRALSLSAQAEYSEADLLFEESQDIRVQTLGADHPDVATVLNNRAASLNARGEYSEADRLYWSAQHIFDSSLGRGHPSAVVVHGNRAKNRRDLVRARARGVVLTGDRADSRRDSFRARRGVDPSYEHDLAYALRASVEEERARQEASSTAVAEQQGATATSNPAAAIGVGGNEAAVAAAGVEESKAGDSGDAGVTVDRDAVQARQAADSEYEALLQAMSLMDDEDEAENMRIAIAMSLEQDTPAPTAPAVAATPEQPPAPSLTPAPTETSATPPPAPAAAAFATGVDSGGAGEFIALSSEQKLSGQAAIDQAGRAAMKDEGEEKEDYTNI